MKNLTRLLFPALITLFFVISFLPIFDKLAFRWEGGDESYCYLVVPVFLYLLWEVRARSSKLKAEREKAGVGGGEGVRDKRFHWFGWSNWLGWLKQRFDAPNDPNVPNASNVPSAPIVPQGFRFGEFSWSVWGLVPIALSLIVIFAGELGSVETLMYLGVWGGAVGLGALLYGKRIRKLAFPFFILLFIVPLPLFFNKVLTFQLRLAASALATKMLQFSGVSAFREGNIIDIGLTQLQVVDACSGLRYFMPLLLLSLLMGHFFCRGWWRRGVLILLVLPLSVGLNALRIWLTGLLTVHGHAELAQDFFHDLAGWVIFMIAGGVLYLASLALKRVGRPGAEKALVDPGARATGMLRPAVLTAVICLVFAGSGWALKKIPTADNLPLRASFERFPMEIGGWLGQRSYIDKETLDNLWADDYVTGTFSKAGLQNAIYLLIPFYKYQGTMHTAHAPQACLLGGGWAPLTEVDRTANVGNGRGITIKTMLMQKGESRILSSYFFFQRGRVITSPWWNKLYLMYDAFTQHRTDGALVRVEMTLAPDQTEEQAFPVLEGFIAELWKILPEYVPL